MLLQCMKMVDSCYTSLSLTPLRPSASIHHIFSSSSLDLLLIYIYIYSFFILLITNFIFDLNVYITYMAGDSEDAG